MFSFQQKLLDMKKKKESMAHTQQKIIKGKWKTNIGTARQII